MLVMSRASMPRCCLKRMQLLDQFEALPDIIDRFQQHPWRGVVIRSVSFAQRDQLIAGAR